MAALGATLKVVVFTIPALGERGLVGASSRHQSHWYDDWR